MFAVKLVDSYGFVSYLSFRNRTAWSKRQAQRHAADVRVSPVHKGLKSVTVDPN